MVRCADMSNTIPDEKVVITYVTYLCARLLDIRHETRAARIIQAAWRKYRLHKHKEIIMVCISYMQLFQNGYHSVLASLPTSIKIIGPWTRG